MTSRTSQSNFRFRVYKMPDGSNQEVYGDQAAPTGAEWLLEDVTVSQTTTKTQNIDEPQKLTS
jgi:hypothetical protein